MWPKLKEQLPLVIVFLVGIAGAVYWLHARTFADLSLRQQEIIANLRADTNAELQASAEQTRRQIDAVNTLLKDAIDARASDMFLTDEEIATVNAEKMESLAAAIAAKIQPFNPLPKTPEEAARQQDQELDQVSAGIATRIEPILAELAAIADRNGPGPALGGGHAVGERVEARANRRLKLPMGDGQRIEVDEQRAIGRHRLDDAVDRRLAERPVEGQDPRVRLGVDGEAELDRDGAVADVEE